MKPSPAAVEKRGSGGRAWLEAVKHRAERASPGPWRVVADRDNYFIVDARGRMVTGEADAEFIVGAREDVARLVSELERVHRAIDRVRDWAEHVEAWSEEINRRGGLSAGGSAERFFVSFGAKKVLSLLHEEDNTE